MKNILLATIFIGFGFFSNIFAQTNIRAIDFQNFTYQPFCGESQPQNYQGLRVEIVSENGCSDHLTKKQIKRGDKDTRVERKIF